MNLDDLIDFVNVPGASLSTESEPVIMSNPPQLGSQLTSQAIGVKDLDDLKEIYGSTGVQAYVIQDILVTPANPWIISGPGPVVVKAGKVTVQPGGQIQVLTDASIKIAELIKLKKQAKK